MKHLTITLLTLLVLGGCTEEISHEKILERNGLHYKVGTIEPITGTVVDYYNNKQIKSRLNYKFGKLDGLQERYHHYGQLTSKRYYKNGLLDGPYKTFRPNGTRESEGSYKEGELEGLQYSYSINERVEIIYNCYMDNGKHKCFEYKE